MAGRTFGLIEGEVGKVLYFTLSYEDENGVEQLFSLTNQTVLLRAWRDDPAGRTIDDVECVAAADQAVNKGEGTFTFDETTAAIATGEHKFRFKTEDGEDPPNVRFFPDDPDDDEASYGVINVRPAY